MVEVDGLKRMRRAKKLKSMERERWRKKQERVGEKWGASIVCSPLRLAVWRSSYDSIYWDSVSFGGYPLEYALEYPEYDSYGAFSILFPSKFLFTRQGQCGDLIVRISCKNPNARPVF